MNFRLHNKVAVITGAGSGIGRATAIMFAGLGAQLALVDVNEDNLRLTVDNIIHKSCACRSYICDVSDDKSLELVFKDILKQTPVDILVNAAGIWESIPVLKLKRAEIERMMSINYIGSFNAIKLVIRQMIKKRSGNIICVASLAGKTGSLIGSSHYAASKGALLALVRSLAREYGKYNININAVTPGLIDTPMGTLTGGRSKRNYVKATALKRVGKPEEVAAVITFLASGLSSYVTGQSWNVCGGYLID